MIKEFLTSRVGIIFVSIIWGLGLSTLFKKSCEGTNCKVIEYHGPPVDQSKHHWSYGKGDCYQWHPYVVDCQSA